MSPVSLHIESKESVGVKPKAQVIEKKSWRQNVSDYLNAVAAGLSRASTQDKVQFFRLLATLINAGISILKSLKILREQSENPRMKKVIQELEEGIESGASFTEVMSEHTDIFTPAQVGMIEAGEASGQLNRSLLQIASEAEKSASLSSKIRGAMFYPATVIALMLAAGYSVMVFVMPRIKEMFENLGGELPAVTKFFIATSDLMTTTTFGVSNAILSLLGLTVLILLFLSWKKTPTGRFLWHKVLMRMPVFGRLVKKIALARFARTFSTLASSGVPIIKALYITADSVGNSVYERRIRQIADDVKQGITMTENMKDDDYYFPNMVVNMIDIAEQTAQIDSITAKLADFYEGEIDDTVKNLSALIEPLIIAVLGLAVATLVLAVMLPILQSSDLAFGGQ